VAQRLRFPTSPEDYAEFYPTAYFDEGGLTDWNCGDHTYSGHHGSDFGGGSWSGMDAGRDIVAAAHGWVLDAHDGEFDRCTSGSCPGGGGWGNFVWLRHASGQSTVYAHLADGSVAVTPGQVVECGDLLGLMGSSGNSTGPHLHLDVRTIDDERIDPFDGPCSSQSESRWVAQGTYMELPSLDCDDSIPACTPTELISCGASVTAHNDDEGSTDAIAFWGCEDSLQTGPELAFEFITDRDEPVSVQVTGLEADLDLVVLDGPACDATGCVAASSEGNTGDESLQFDAVAGHSYVIAIDGWDGATSSFALTTSCEGSLPVPEGGAGGGSAGAGGASVGGGGSDAAPPASPTGVPGDDGGCGCRIERGRSPSRPLVALALVMALLPWARRRRAVR
jgi:MYXO-CTERM domain-containing protein